MTSTRTRWTVSLLAIFGADETAQLSALVSPQGSGRMSDGMAPPR